MLHEPAAAMMGPPPPQVADLMGEVSPLATLRYWYTGEASPPFTLTLSIRRPGRSGAQGGTR